MLTKTASTLPGPTALPGGTAWEWKYDGYRAVLQAPATNGINLWSRNGTNLAGVFPMVRLRLDVLPQDVELQ